MNEDQQDLSEGPPPSAQVKALLHLRGAMFAIAKGHYRQAQIHIDAAARRLAAEYGKLPDSTREQTEMILQEMTNGTLH